MNSCKKSDIILHAFTFVDSMNTEGFVDCFSNDGVFQFANLKPLESKEEIFTFVKNFLGSLKEIKHTQVSIMESGDEAIARGVVHYYLSHSKIVKLDFCNYVKFKEDKISRWQVYIDVAPLYST